MLPTMNFVITKAATSLTDDFSFIHKKWREYLITLKDFFKNILLQDTVIKESLYLIKRCSQDVLGATFRVSLS